MNTSFEIQNFQLMTHQANVSRVHTQKYSKSEEIFFYVTDPTHEDAKQGIEQF